MKSIDEITTKLYNSLYDLVAPIFFKQHMENSEQFRAMFYDNPIMSYLVDPETRHVVDANNALISYLGYDKDKLFSMDISEFSLTSSINRDVAFRDAHYGPMNFQRKFKLANGVSRDVEIHTGPIILKRKKLFYSTVVDVTEKNSQEQQLKLFKQIVLSFTDAVTVADSDNNIILVNDAFSKMYGYSSDEIFGKPTSILYSEKNPPETSETVHLSALVNKWSGELYNKRKDGTEFPIYLSASPVLDDTNNVVALVGIARDITIEKNNLEAIATNEKRFREFIDLLPQGVFEIDTRGNLRFVNNQGLKIFGYTKEDYSKGINISKIISPQEHSKAFARIQDALESDEMLSEEYTVMLKNGSSFSALVMTTRIVQDNKPVGLRGLVIDISKQKAIQRDLSKALENMNAVVPKGYIPICANCKNIRNKDDVYEKLETYFSREGYMFSHGICPDCMPILYPQYAHISKDKSSRK